MADFRVLIVDGVEPSPTPIKGVALPLSYANLLRRAATVAPNLFRDPEYNTPHPFRAANATRVYLWTMPP